MLVGLLVVRPQAQKGRNAHCAFDLRAALLWENDLRGRPPGGCELRAVLLGPLAHYLVRELLDCVSRS